MTFYTFANATTAIPLSNLDANFATPITLGNTAVTINGTFSSIGNLTLNNATIASGNSTVTKETVTTITSPAATNLTIQSAGTTAMTIDTSGNVLVGTTSSAAVGGSVVLSSGGFSMSAGQGIGFNIGYNGGFKYVGNGYGLLINQTNGDTVFQRAANNVSGAGAAATLNESMRIDSSGNVGIGTSSPGAKLQVSGNTISGNYYTGTGAGSAGTFGADSAGSGASIVLYGSTAANPNTILFGYSGGERMRIDSSGNLSLGMTGGGSRFNLTTVTNGSQSAFTVVDGNTGGLNWGMGPRVGTGTVTDFGFYNNTGLVFLGRFTSSGVWYQGNNSSAWSVTSDARIKKNIVPVIGGLSVITQLKPVEFDYIENDKHDVGFIAQDYQNVLPSQITEGNDGMLSLQQNLIPYLVAAIQELKSEFDAYKASHP
jgi:hypothetical protein